MTPQEMRALRLTNQRLAGHRCSTPQEVVGWFGAIQAQDYTGAKWSIAERTAASVSSAQLDDLLAEGMIIRTHLLRPTWHFVVPEDIRWLLALTAPRIQTREAYRHRQLGLDATTLNKATKLMCAALKGNKQLTRYELAEVLNRGGIVTTGQRMPHLLMHAELTATICSGGRKDKQHTYALLDERVGRSRTLSGDEALAELAKRYFASHGPATVKDYMWWSSLTAAQARRGIELLGSQLEHIAVGPRTYYAASLSPLRREPAATAHLMHPFDEYLVAYTESKDIYNDAVLTEARSPNMLTNTLVLDGQVVGLWRRTLKRGDVAIALQLFTKLSRQQHQRITNAVQTYGGFLGLTAHLSPYA